MAFQSSMVLAWVAAIVVMVASSAGFFLDWLPVEMMIFAYYGSLAVPIVLGDVNRAQIDAFFEMDSPRGRALATVKLAVFLDMIGVGIFVPMLSYYWRELGVRTEFIGFMSSAYNIAQIISGIVLGYVSDHLLGSKNVLLLSFAGSAVSYALAGVSYQSGAISALVFSRFLVGLVKQTMTISRAITVSLEPDDVKRTTALSHLRAVTTLAFMIGPTIGGLLSKYFSKAVPAYVAAALFIFNFLSISAMLPNDIDALEARSSAAGGAEVQPLKVARGKSPGVEVGQPARASSRGSTGSVAGADTRREVRARGTSPGAGGGKGAGGRGRSPGRSGAGGGGAAAAAAASPAAVPSLKETLAKMKQVFLMPGLVGLPP